MAYTEIKALNYMLSAKMNEALTEAITDGWQPVSEFTIDKSSRFSVVLAKGSDNQFTEVKVYTAMRQADVFAKALALTGQGYTIDNQIGFKNGQFFIVAYKGSRAGGGGSSSVAWGDITGKPSTFTPTTGTTAGTALVGTSTLSTIPGTVPVTKGGTGATTAAAAWSALGGGDVGKLAALPVASTTTAGVIQIGTGATNAMAGNYTLATLSGTVPMTRGGTGATTAAAARANLELGALAQKNAGAAVSNASNQSSTVPASVAEDADLAAVITALNAVITCLTAVRSNSGSAATQVNALMLSLRNAGVIAAA